MAQNSKIQWCHHTANLWWGCVSVHIGCLNCYAETLSKRFGDDVWGNDKPRREIKSVWNDLLRYQRLAKEANEIHRVFVGSMMDIFEKPMPLIDKNKLYKEGVDTGWLRDLLFQQISAGLYPNLMFLFLTKRPSNINKYIPEDWKISPPKNVMFGTSPVNQETANKLIPQLLKVNGKLFLSIEPMLDSVDLTSIQGTDIFKSLYQVLQPITNCGDSNRPAISWVICGGESGGHKRPFNADWARKLRDDCKKYHVPFFMKQIDKVQPIPSDLQIEEFYK